MKQFQTHQKKKHRNFRIETKSYTDDESENESTLFIIMLKIENDYETPVHSAHYQNEYTSSNFYDINLNQTAKQYYIPCIFDNHANTINI